MDDDLMFEYLVSIGAMRPEEAQLRKKQAMIDALREQSMEPSQGQNVGGVYVAPSITQHLAKLGGSYMAAKQQQGLDSASADMNARQRQMLEDLRKRKRGLASPTAPTQADPYSGLPTYGNEA